MKKCKKCNDSDNIKKKFIESIMFYYTNFERINIVSSSALLMSDEISDVGRNLFWLINDRSNKGVGDVEFSF